MEVINIMTNKKKEMCFCGMKSGKAVDAVSGDDNNEIATFRIEKIASRQSQT